ncbi:thiol reductant ABC exporter subunit CydD [Leucobacter chromiiresistens]|uniref:ATP-binding cassette, subfamily C, CydD n=1 Tax=Leucobacter chromiiresistens TaxID=1079994 RepID=A0A1H1A5T7_9MICO|nr:thiol reductant ABC exporter subunit CydD [Leucobacter chromiiresistens]SDQ34861.1 ATP-binding cassette, subfamily C, CydD [Leucobacter chromiiresistens]
MKPFDPRLLRYARAARGVLLIGAGLGLLRTCAVLAWSWCLANAITALALPVMDGIPGVRGRIDEGAYGTAQLTWLLLGALAAVLVRSLAGWGMDVVAARGAVRVKAQLRSAALDALDARSPQRDSGPGDAELATSLGRGLDALDGYFSGYIPQLLLTGVATPILVLAVLLADPLSGLIVIVVFPIIPVFMILIGLATQAVQDRQWSQLQRLSSSFLDVVAGLATLRIFGRQDRQIARISRETEEYRSRTMSVLRVTFLSGFVLDLAGTFSIALVAVTVGTRLVSGEFPLGLGLFVLLLLPETFVPIRQVGAAFHASTEGLAAAGRVFEIIESADAPRGAAGHSRRTASTDGGPGVAEGAAVGAAADAAQPALVFDEVSVARSGRRVVGPTSFAVGRGELVAMAGPSGAGKSTLVAALLGFVEPIRGRIVAPERIAWAGQRPGLLHGSIAANVALGDRAPDDGLVRRALDSVGLQHLDGGAELGVAGAGVSGGQAQRIAVARALYRAWNRDCAVLVLDEPTSALDPESEAVVCAALRREADGGRAVLVVSHREAVHRAADRVVRVAAARPEPQIAEVDA